MPKVVAIASRLAQIRKDEGLGARPFAEKISAAGYSVTHVSVLSYEAGEGTEKVPAAYCIAVARALGLSVEYVLGLSDRKVTPPPTAPTEAQKRLQNIAREVDEARRVGAIGKDKLVPTRPRSADKTER